MRVTWLLVPAFLPLLALAACSSSSADPVVGAPDAPASDSGVASDTGAPVDSGPAADAGPCVSPSGCPASDVCCGTIPITGGSVPNCTTGTISVKCTAAASCNTSLGSSCSGTQTVRLCKTNADCTEPNDDKCCTFGGADGGLSFCASALVGAFGGGKCQ